ncbi:MAG: hypothetical protein HY890_07540 [Deltaproteobacteria bacterium]|nr:hypothetical protein [Deltaproteobacteria bacterium]
MAEFFNILQPVKNENGKMAVEDGWLAVKDGVQAWGVRNPPLPSGERVGVRG